MKFQQLDQFHQVERTDHKYRHDQSCFQLNEQVTYILLWDTNNYRECRWKQWTALS